MRLLSLITIVGLAAGQAMGQPVSYTLTSGAKLNSEYCLPPCVCAPVGMLEDLTGEFQLEPLDVGPGFRRYRLSAIQFEARPGGDLVTVTGIGTYTITEPAHSHRLQLSATIGVLPVIREFDSGLVPVDPKYPFPHIAITTTTGLMGCSRETVMLKAAPPETAPCYANCDGSSEAPLLNVADFTCFLQHFAAGSAYANCDGSVTPPVLNVADFSCFLQRFAAGCP